MLEQPLLRVSRTKAACTRCRAAKTKCDGKLPACTACERTGRGAECANSNDQFAQGTERSYVATLESRVEKLEKKLAKSRAEKQNTDVRRPSLQLLTRSNTFPTGNTTRSPVQTLEENTVDSLVSDFGLLSVNATARDYYGFTSSVSYARLIMAAALKNPLPSGPKASLPPRRDALFLVEHYMKNLFLVLPIFEETAFWTSFDAFFSNSRHVSPMDIWNVRMVLAISLVSFSERHGDIKYYEAISNLLCALEVADHVLHPGSASSIQAMFLLVEYSRLDAHHFDVWTLIGAASRNLVDLGLHQDPHRGTAIPRGKLEFRRRIYHCLYVLDRGTSIICRRTFSFTDASAAVAFPRMSGANSKPENASRIWLQSYESAFDLFHLRQIQSKFYQDIFQTSRSPWKSPYTYIWSCWHKLDAWYRKLSSKTPEAFLSLARLEVLLSYIYLLAPNFKVPQTSPFAQSLLFEYCIESVEVMSSALQSPHTRRWLMINHAVGMYIMGHHFLECVSQNTTWILSGTIPTEATAQLQHDQDTTDDKGSANEPDNSSKPPPFPYPARQDNRDRALRCISRLQDVLGMLGVRLGFMKWRDRFQKESQDIVTAILAWQMPDAALHSGSGDPYVGNAALTQQQFAQPFMDHLYAQEMPQEWVDTLDLRGLLPPYPAGATECADAPGENSAAGGSGDLLAGFAWNDLSTAF